MVPVRSANQDHLFEIGFAPGCTFGQWVSALARSYAINRSPETREKVLRLNRLYAKTIGGDFYENTRFPAYSYDKLVCGLIDSHQYARRSRRIRHPGAKPPRRRCRTCRRKRWSTGKLAAGHGLSRIRWDESYTMSENLFLAYQRGAGEQYRALGVQYLDDAYYDPLAEGRSNLEGRHAYSHVNSLCSAMQAYYDAGQREASAGGEKRFRLGGGAEFRHRRVGSGRDAARARAARKYIRA